MALRANYFDLASEAMQILMKQEGYLHIQFGASETVTIPVWELVKLRVQVKSERRIDEKVNDNIDGR